jgi:REP element-mobilizing transposase RayT
MKVLLEPDKYYHIYNHANGSENLFVNEGNYFYFLKRYIDIITPIADTYAYCLIPNHFHFAVRIKSGDALACFKSLDIEDSWFLSKQFANLFSSYTQAFNKQQHRRGSLFIPNFERKELNSEEYFKVLIHYIHNNPVHHGFVSDLRDWKYSSYKSFFSHKSTKLARNEVVEWFGGIDDFLLFHQKKIDTTMLFEWKHE